MGNMGSFPTAHGTSAFVSPQGLDTESTTMGLTQRGGGRGVGGKEKGRNLLSKLGLQPADSRSEFAASTTRPRQLLA